MGPPRQGPARIQSGNPGQGFGQLVAIRAADAEISGAVRRQLMRLIKDHQIIRFSRCLPQPAKHSLPGQRVQTDNDLIAGSANKGIGGLRVNAADNRKGKAEQGLQFALPVSNQTSRRHDQHPPDQAPG